MEVDTYCRAVMIVLASTLGINFYSVAICEYKDFCKYDIIAHYDSQYLYLTLHCNLQMSYLNKYLRFSFASCLLL